MKKSIAKFWFWLSGWKMKMEVNLEDHPKSVMVAAPHTSNWDFVYAIFAFWIMGIDLKFFIKDSYTRPWYGFLFRWLGAIGVDRTNRNNLVEHSIDLLNSKTQLTLLVPAEGTRARVEKWKMGFYHIAKGANVPILLGYLDFKEKNAGVTKAIHLSNDKEKDLDIIQETYLRFTPKHPENYNPKIH